MAFEDLRKLQRIAIGGAAVTKSTDILKHARDPTALSGDISGLTQIGIAGATAKTMMDAALGFKLKKRKVKRR